METLVGCEPKWLVDVFVSTAAQLGASVDVTVQHPGDDRMGVPHRSQSDPPHGTEHELHIAPDHLSRHVHALQWVVTEHADIQ